MISLNASTLQFPLYLPMTLNAYWLSNQQVIVTNSNKASTTYTWSYTFNLLFNESKFVHLCFWQKNSLDTPRYAINGNLLRRMSQHKDLGVTFSTDLHWTEHYNIIIAKAYQTLGLLRRTFSVSSTAAKKQLYISLVRSQLLYCSKLWRPQLLKDVFTLERVQRRATKYILNN